MDSIKTPNKNDMRVKRTRRAAYNALITLLGYRNFSDITVNDLCSEAFISRPTFYVYFNDKYDLLKHFLIEVKNNFIKKANSNDYDEIGNEVNQFIYSNKKLITNIFKNANDETLMLIHEFISSIVRNLIKKDCSSGISIHNTIFLYFFIGGYVNLLKWMVENNFPPEFSGMGKYLYRMLQAINAWEADQDNVWKAEEDMAKTSTGY